MGSLKRAQQIATPTPPFTGRRRFVTLCDMSFLLALDQGTTGSTAMVFDDAGHALSRVNHEIPQNFPKPGWVEHDPNDLWEITLRAGREALAAAGLCGADITAIGITNQRETLVLWDRFTGEPIGPAIVWQDRRTADTCARWRARGLEPMIRQKTGLLLDPYFSATKLHWRLQQDPALRQHAHAGTVDSWLIHRLTGGTVYATDPSNASRTLLYNLQAGEWDDELLALFDVPRDMLPEIRPSSGDFGTTDPQWFGAAIPIAGVAGDQQAALFGQGAFAPGKVKSTYGTGNFLLMNTGGTAIDAPDGLLSTLAWQRRGHPRQYALEGAIFNTGASVQWLRDGLGILATAAESETLARSVPDTGDVFFVPALSGLGAPHWDPTARGTIIGITRGTTRAHLVRATLEAIAFQVYDVVDCMRLAAGITLDALYADGGATANSFLMQFQSDLLQTPIYVPAIPETTALGAAYLAGLHAGVWPDPAALLAHRSIAAEYHPTMSPAERDRRVARWRRAVERSRDWASGTDT